METVRFKVESKKLLCAMKKAVNGMANTRAVMPITKCFVFSVAGDKLYVTCCNGAVKVKASVDITSTEETRDVTFALFGKKALYAVQTLDAQELEVSVYEYQVGFRHNDGEFLLFRERDDDASMFNYELPNLSLQLKVESPCITSVFGKCIRFVNKDELRPVMNGVLVEVSKGGTNFVASDGHRLIVVKKESISNEQPFSFIIRKELVKALLSVTPKTGFSELLYDDKNKTILIRTDDVECSAKVIEGRYPSYRSVIPEAFSYTSLVDRKSLASRLSRLILFANQSCAVAFRFKEDCINMFSFDGDEGDSSSERVPAACQWPPEVLFGFNGNKLIEALKVLTCHNIVFNLGDDAKGVVIEPADADVENIENIKILFMPMLLNEDYNNKL